MDVDELAVRKATLEHALQDNPYDYDAIEELGLIYATSGDHRLAVETLASRVADESSRALVFPEEVWKTLGSSRLQVWLHDVARQAALLKQAVEALRQSSSLHSLDVLSLTARCYEGLGDFSGAVQMLSNWTMDFPKADRLPEAMLYAGLLCFHSETAAYAQAAKYLEYVIRCCLCFRSLSIARWPCMCC